MAKILGQLVHVGGGGCRSLAEVIDDVALAGGALNRHEADAAKSAHPGLDDADGERGRDGGVDRVAALIEDVISGPHGPGVLGGDHLTAAGRQISRNTKRCLGVHEQNLARFLMSRSDHSSVSDRLSIAPLVCHQLEDHASLTEGGTLESTTRTVASSSGRRRGTMCIPPR